VAGLIDAETGAIAAPENDPAAVAALLRKYAVDPELQRRQGDAGRERAAATFDREQVAARVEAILLAGA
jgi:glycosyltransferase involved in cell wall biosynthesis